MKSTSIRRVKSADRTLDLLERLAGSAPVRASALAKALGIPKSSLFHLIGTLAERNYIVPAGDNGYRLGPKLAELARAAGGAPDPEAVINPIIESLSEALNETCGFNVQRGDEVAVTTTRSGRHALTYTMKPGDLAPLYAVSAGKILLAAQDPAWLDAYLERVRFERFTASTIQSHERLLRDIERARAEGFGFVDEEFTPGIVGFGAVVRLGGRVVGAINVAIPRARFDEQAASIIRQQLRIAVARAEAALAPNNQARPDAAD